MVYAATLSEYQRLMQWYLIIQEFGPNIQYIAVVDNIVSNTLSIFLSIYVEKYEPITKRDQCRVNELFAISMAENNKYCFPLNLLNAQIEQPKELRKVNSKLSTYISD